MCGGGGHRCHGEQRKRRTTDFHAVVGSQALRGSFRRGRHSDGGSARARLDRDGRQLRPACHRRTPDRRHRKGRRHPGARARGAPGAGSRLRMAGRVRAARSGRRCDWVATVGGGALRPAATLCPPLLRRRYRGGLHRRGLVVSRIPCPLPRASSGGRLLRTPGAGSPPAGGSHRRPAATDRHIPAIGRRVTSGNGRRIATLASRTGRIISFEYGVSCVGGRDLGRHLCGRHSSVA